MRDSFIFYKSFYDSISRIKNKELKAELYEAIFELALNNNDIELTDEVGLMIMDLIKPQILANSKRYEDGKKGGRPKKLTSGYENKKTSGYKNKKPNVNVNDNVNVNVNVNDNNIYIVEIIDYLNQKLGTKYKPNTPKTITCIKARLKEKYTIDDFKKVIDKKIKEWKDTEMEKYLRPETLFGTKFESYLNQKEYKTQYEKNKEMMNNF